VRYHGGATSPATGTPPTGRDVGAWGAVIEERYLTRDAKTALTLVTIANNLAEQGYRLIAAANQTTLDDEIEIVGFFEKE